MANLYMMDIKGEVGYNGVMIFTSKVRSLLLHSALESLLESLLCASCAMLPIE